MIHLSQLNQKEILTATTTLLAVIDIIGSVPIVLSIKAENNGLLPYRNIALVATVIMFGFLLLGETLLNYLDLDLHSLGIAGSILLFVVASEMVFGIKIYQNTIPEVAVYVPLAFPIIAGVGSLTVLMSLKSQYALINIIIALLINLIWVFIVMKNAQRFEYFLGKKGIAILRKVFGVILITISIKIFTSNILSIIQLHSNS